MIENNQKGWHGCYSRYGKNSAEQFNEIMKKDKILKESNKKYKIKDIFHPDKKINKLDYIQDSLKVFQIYQNSINEEVINKKIHEKKKNKIEFFNKNIFKNKKFKYHNKHILNDKKKKLKGTISIPNIGYNPKYTLIYNKTLSGPQWKNISGRIYPKKEIDTRDFLFNENNMTNNSGEFKCLVNMNKTTKRGEFINLKDVRIRNDKPFIKDKKSKTKLMKNSKAKTPYKASKMKNFLELPNFDSSSDENMHKNNINKRHIISSYQNKTSTSFFHRNKSRENHQSKISNSDHERVIKSSFSEKKIISHDFRKDTSREYMERIRNKNQPKFLISYLTPNYSCVLEKSISNIRFSDDKDKHHNKYKKKIFIGIEPNFLFDPNKVIEKYNNHKSVKAPNFNLMSSRRLKNNNNLPCYMNIISQRGSNENINEKTLELNGYSNGYLRPSKSYFFPKKSYNNIINLNLINSNVFQNKIKNDEVNEKINIIKNEINFNYKGYEDLIKEGALKRFDGVTYKSYKHNNNAKIKDLLYNSNNNIN